MTYILTICWILSFHSLVPLTFGFYLDKLYTLYSSLWLTECIHMRGCLSVCVCLCVRVCVFVCVVCLGTDWSPQHVERLPFMLIDEQVLLPFAFQIEFPKCALLDCQL